MRNRCGNGYLSKGMTTESEVADTEGSTATAVIGLGKQVPKLQDLSLYIYILVSVMDIEYTSHILLIHSFLHKPLI